MAEIFSTPNKVSIKKYRKHIYFSYMLKLDCITLPIMYQTMTHVENVNKDNYLCTGNILQWTGLFKILKSQPLANPVQFDKAYNELKQIDKGITG